MLANDFFYVKSIATYAPTFFRYIISVLAIVLWFHAKLPQKILNGF